MDEQKLKKTNQKKGRRFKKAKTSGMDEHRARYIDIEQMVKVTTGCGKGLCEWHSTEWPRIRKQQAILEICEVPKTRNFWYICS